MNIVTEALDALGLALVEHDHIWTTRQRQLYERAISVADCMEIDLSASAKRPSQMPSSRLHLRCAQSSER